VGGRGTQSDDCIDGAVPGLYDETHSLGAAPAVPLELLDWVLGALEVVLTNLDGKVGLDRTLGHAPSVGSRSCGKRRRDA
jgi:hypothetical protein